MSDCCSTSGTGTSPAGKHACPASGNECHEVSIKTILHHLVKPWEWIAKDQAYYFCDAPECDVVYFGEDNSVTRKSEVRSLIGLKDNVPQALLCYCFGVTKAEAEKNPLAKDFVLQKTKAGLCSCETSNPSGRCCLKDFPRKV